MTYVDSTPYLHELWDSFDTPIDEETENILEPFLWWPIGTNRWEIWDWFEEMSTRGLHDLVFGAEE